MVLVDTDALFDVIEDDPEWGDCSQSRIEAASLRGPLLINAVIYAELSKVYGRIEDLDRMVRQTGLRHASIPPGALFLAGKAFLQYRKRRGGKSGVTAPIFPRSRSSAPIDIDRVGNLLMTLRNCRLASVVACSARSASSFMLTAVRSI